MHLPIEGDILFGGNTGCLYGKYSHCAIARTESYRDYYEYTYNLDDGNPPETVSGYGWTGMTIEATPTDGDDDVISREFQRFLFYDFAAIGYVDPASYSEACDAVQEAISYSGPYDWNASFFSNTEWNCSKLVSRAYYDSHDYVLANFMTLIYPDDIYYNYNVAILDTFDADYQLNLSEEDIKQLNIQEEKGVETSNIQFKERLSIYKEKGVDARNIQVKKGINKEGFGKYLLRLQERIKMSNKEFKNYVKAKYKINNEQYDQIINDAKK